MRSLGLASDLLALEGLSRIEEHPDRIVLRTPGEPDFWSGNMVVRRGPPGAPEAEVALFRQDLPDAGHLRIAWDVPDLDPAPVRAAWEPLGVETEVSDVLARSGPPSASMPPGGYVLRELASDVDWEEAFGLGLRIGMEEGFAPDAHAPYLRRRFASRRRQVAQGLLQWWGAFRDAELAAAMSVVTGRIDGQPIARYQAVETAPEHRRRGLCSALLVCAAQGALEREREARLVIVAEPEGRPAGSIVAQALRWPSGRWPSTDGGTEGEDRPPTP